MSTTAVFLDVENKLAGKDHHESNFIDGAIMLTHVLYYCDPVLSAAVWSVVFLLKSRIL